MNIAIEKRENFDAMIDREMIFAQNIDFFDVSIDEKFDEISKEITSDSIIDFDDVKNMLFERSNTIFDTNIEKNKNFDDAKNDEIIE